MDTGRILNYSASTPQLRGRQGCSMMQRIIHETGVLQRREAALAALKKKTKKRSLQRVAKRSRCNLCVGKVPNT
jgi:hypothetical protein